MVERDYYRLTELAERWECTVHDLLHMGSRDRAQICANAYGMVKAKHMVRIVDEPEIDESDLDDLDKEGAEALRAEFDKWKARTTTDMPAGFYEIEIDDLRFCEMPDAFPLEMHSAMRFDRGAWWQCEFDPPIQIDIGHLFMLREEVERLDRETFGRAPRTTERAGTTGTTERNTLLRIIAVLAVRGYGIDPKASRIEKLGEVRRDAEELGLSVSDDTLRAKLREAFDMIEKSAPTAR